MGSARKNMPHSLVGSARAMVTVMNQQVIGALDRIIVMANRLHEPGELKDLLQVIVDGAASMFQAPRASLRLLDPTRTRLLAICRSGEPMHEDPSHEFVVGEGLVGWIVENRKSLRTGDAQEDERFIERPDRKEEMVSYMGAPILSGKVCLGAIAVLHPQTDHFTEVDEHLLSLLGSICGPYVEMRRLAHVTTMDPLTSVMNRRGLDVTLPEQSLSAASCEMPISVVMVDLDRFKSVNDRYGHVVGDQVLKEVAQVLAGTLGAGDAVVRYGGEEFLVILPGVHLDAAGRVAEQIRRTLQTSSFDFRAVQVPVTASLGVAERRPDESRADLIRRADLAMFEAKRRGRNKVVVGA